MQPNEQTAPGRRRFTLDEYERMIDAGVLGAADRVELIEGEILVMSPERSRHAATIDIVAEVLRERFGGGYTVRIQHPLALGPWSEPEPDLCVVAGGARDYLHAHPTSALLVVEVAETSLAFDRKDKALLYASVGLPDYWIVNLVDACVEVHRDPGGSRYASVTRLSAGDHVSPVGVATAPIAVSALLP